MLLWDRDADRGLELLNHSGHVGDAPRDVEVMTRIEVGFLFVPHGLLTRVDHRLAKPGGIARLPVRSLVALGQICHHEPRRFDLRHHASVDQASLWLVINTPEGESGLLHGWLEVVS